MKNERRKDGRGRVAQIRQEPGEILRRGMDGVPWRVVPTVSDRDNADTTFSLGPGPAAPRPPLAALQRDLDTIAQHLRDVVFDEARKLSLSAGSGAGG